MANKPLTELQLSASLSQVARQLAGEGNQQTQAQLLHSSANSVAKRIKRR